MARSSIRRERSEARRDSIVETAVRLFAIKGYRATSVAAVAAEVGITDAGVLYHFPAKSDLLLAVLRHHEETQRERFSELVRVGGLDAIRNLRGWGYVMEQHPEIASLHVILGAEHLLEESPTNAFFKARYARLLTTFSAEFERGIADGEIKPEIDASVEAASLMAVLDGLRLQHFFAPEVSPLGDRVRDYVDTLVMRIET